jgi:hypothetical protein
VPPEDDPRKVFTRLFTDAGASSGALEDLRTQRKSVLDAVMRDFKRLQGKVGAEDRQKLERHASTVRDFGFFGQAGWARRRQLPSPRVGPGGEFEPG